MIRCLSPDPPYQESGMSQGDRWRLQREKLKAAAGKEKRGGPRCRRRDYKGVAEFVDS